MQSINQILLWVFYFEEKTPHNVVILNFLPQAAQLISGFLSSVVIIKSSFNFLCWLEGDPREQTPLVSFPSWFSSLRGKLKCSSGMYQ